MRVHGAAGAGVRVHGAAGAGVRVPGAAGAGAPHPHDGNYADKKLSRVVVSCLC